MIFFYCTHYICLNAKANGLIINIIPNVSQIQRYCWINSALIKLAIKNAKKNTLNLSNEMSQSFRFFMVLANHMLILLFCLFIKLVIIKKKK